MHKMIWISIAASLLLACTNDNTGKQGADKSKEAAPVSSVAKDTSKKSIPSETSKRVGNTTIKIAYTAPVVRGRVIWGGLVPYDNVWVTGAHKATSLEIDQAFRVGNKTIPAGKYALFTIPGKEEWTVIINKNWNQHLTDDYKESEDLVRLKIKPLLTGQVLERLKYEIDQTGERKANIIMSWEKIRVPIPIEIE